MSAHNTEAKAASGLSLARRTLEGVRGGHAAGLLQQATLANGDESALASDVASTPSEVSVTLEARCLTRIPLESFLG